MNKKTKILLAILAGLALLTGCWLSGIEKRKVERSFRSFVFDIGKGEYGEAYNSMTTEYKSKHSLQEFTNSLWCNPSSIVYCTAVQNSGLHMVYVSSINYYSQRAEVVATTAVMIFPVSFEDGLIATKAVLRKESGLWKVDGSVDTVMR